MTTLWQGDTWQFFLFALGRRGPRTAVTAAERELLADLARGRLRVVEVGVYEGATSQVLSAAMDPAGCLMLVDPWVPGVRLERLFGVSFAQIVTRRTLRSPQVELRFVRRTSLAAAAAIPAGWQAGLVFIDADHSYDAVLADFLAWSKILGPGGVLAFHDSRPCPARPNLDWETGPVRLLDEIRAGEHGAWKVEAEADSVTAIGRREQ